MAFHKFNILFRADGNSAIGLGHVIRSLALAEMIQTLGKLHFIIKNPSEYLKKEILKICDKIIVLQDNLTLTEEANLLAYEYGNNNCVFVLDGYHFKTSYQQKLKNSGSIVVSIDDIHNCHFVSDIVINHAEGITYKMYSKESYTKLLLGSKFVLLRKPFRTAENKNRKDQKLNKVFICFGGSDPNNDTLEALKKCSTLKYIEKCYIVIGNAYKHHESLSYWLNESKMRVEIHQNLNAQKLVEIMLLCPIAITPPSTISLEYLSIGGLLFLLPTADNQADNYNFLLSNSLAFDLNEIENIKQLNIEQTLKKQDLLFDSKQDLRFKKIFKQLKNGHST